MMMMMTHALLVYTIITILLVSEYCTTTTAFSSIKLRSYSYSITTNNHHPNRLQYKRYNDYYESSSGYVTTRTTNNNDALFIQQQYNDHHQHAENNHNTYTNNHNHIQQQLSEIQQLQQQQSLDYEDMVNARFSRRDRRARLRRSVTYGAEMDIQRKARMANMSTARRHAAAEAAEMEERLAATKTAAGTPFDQKPQLQRQATSETTSSSPPPQLLVNTQVKQKLLEKQQQHHEQQQQRTSKGAGISFDQQPQLLQRRQVSSSDNTHPMPSNNINHQSTNTDFPGSNLPSSQWDKVSKHPLPFPDAEYMACERRTLVGGGPTCILIPFDDYIAQEIIHRNNGSGGNNNEVGGECITLNGINYLIHSVYEDDDNAIIIPQNHPQQHNNIIEVIDRAYWLQSKLHNAIYGQVRYGTILQRLDNPLHVQLPTSSSSLSSSLKNNEVWTQVEWIITSNSVAVKEMNWEIINTQRETLAEDPIKEVAAMQYLQRYASSAQQQQLMHHGSMELETSLESTQTHVMMPIDLLSDDVNLYSITPYCTSGRLLDQIENKSRFSEPEARYWMRQILTGLTCLKNAGVAHRDMSPENLMVHDGQVYIIDLGMCLKIPSFHNDDHHYQQNQRALITPQTPCGKWYYLSPEVCQSEQPFDGPTVDLWAAGVILFIMLTGIPPWEEPRMSDENFKLMSTGHLFEILTERRVGLSVDAMDLLQRMFWLDPTDRLSLEQVCDHPWVMHNEYNVGEQ